MHLAIHSLQSTLFNGEAEKIIARTPAGEITVLENHIPLISSLLPQNLKFIDREHKEHIISISSGFLEVKPESETVILVEAGNKL